MFMFGKNRIVREHIDKYLKIMQETVSTFAAAMEHYREHGIDEHFHTLVQKTHGSESDADDVRREIESELFEKSLLPEVREDVMLLIEHMDKIPNKCEHILQRIYIHNLVLPEAYRDKLAELVNLGVEGCNLLPPALRDVLGKCKEIRELARRIDDLESIGDDLENELICMIFRDDLDPAERLLYRDLVIWVGDLLDRAETMADRLTIFGIKRDV